MCHSELGIIWIYFDYLINYSISLDNYYTSPELCDILLSYLTNMVGTVRLNKKDLPSVLRNKKFKSAKSGSYII